MAQIGGAGMMRKTCYLCGERLKQDQLVEVTVIAPYVEIKSKVTYSIGKPIDAYPDTLRHHECESND